MRLIRRGRLNYQGLTFLFDVILVWSILVSGSGCHLKTVLMGGRLNYQGLTFQFDVLLSIWVRS